MNKNGLPTISVLATGGTIASTAADQTTFTDYAVTEGIASMLAAVPGLDTIANLRSKQVLNVDSRRITNKMLIKLASEVDKELAQAEVDGVVVTHGTDTLEETAYFLNLVVKSAKPVVVVGAMRPASALSADGPLNLYNAILLAGHRAAAGKGVLVCLNDRVLAARQVTKTHTTQVDTFGTADLGCLGQVHDGRVDLFLAPSRLHTLDTDFAISGLKKLPMVDVMYDHQDAGLHLYEAAIRAGTQGIVIAGLGNGSLSPQAEKGARLALRHGIVCARGSRTGSGIVSRLEKDRKRGLVSTDSLNPQKARILLMLALTITRDRDAIQSYFDRY
jgi:L-asparaginase